MTLRQIRLLVTSGDLNIDLSENMTKYFRKYSLSAIQRFFSRLFIPLSFELRGVVIFTPPHNGEGGWDRHRGVG